MNPKSHRITRISSESIWRAVLGLAIGSCLVAAGCAAPAQRAARGVMDTPEHHTLRGHDAIDAGDWEKADREFDLALSLDREFALAQAGKAVVVAHGATEFGISAEQREAIAEQADDLIDQARGNADTPEEERGVHVAAVRMYTLTGTPDDWLEEAEDHFEDAIDTEGGIRDPHPYYYMARAYRTAFQLDQASDLYERVLELDAGKTKEADEELAVVQKVQRARPGTRHGQAVAFLEAMKRADIAALFVEELLLERLYTRGGAQVDTSFQPSDQTDFEADSIQRAPQATDIADHPLRSDIEEILRLGVVGLEPDPAHRFNPDADITRAEFAMMVEDILVKVTGETGVRTKFIGQVSPYPDVRNDLPYFNAVQTVVTRNLMKPKEGIRGLFKPLDPLTGAEALLVIRLLRDELRSYLRS